jgi:hypothetical protein
MSKLVEVDGDVDLIGWGPVGRAFLAAGIW